MSNFFVFVVGIEKPDLFTILENYLNINWLKMQELAKKENWIMRINRNKYLNELRLRMNNGMIKVVTGIRRCGKSYLLNYIFTII